jgi:hypothetical protein
MSKEDLTNLVDLLMDDLNYNENIKIVALAIYSRPYITLEELCKYISSLSNKEIQNILLILMYDNLCKAHYLHFSATPNERQELEIKAGKSLRSKKQTEKQKDCPYTDEYNYHYTFELNALFNSPR